MVPPLVQLAGAEPRGPKTVKVMVLASLVPEEPLNVAEMVDGEMGPAVAVTGADTVRVGEALPTAISAIAGPQVEVNGRLVESPL